MIHESSSSSRIVSSRSEASPPTTPRVDRPRGPTTATRGSATRVGSPENSQTLRRRNASTHLGRPVSRRAADAPGPLDRPIVLSNPSAPLVPPAPGDPPQAGHSPSPQQLGQHIATRHRTPLTDTGKTAVYGLWSGAVGTRGLNSITEGSGEVGAAFGILGVIGQVYDAYSTHSDAKKAQDDFVMAGVLLAQQGPELAQAQARLRALSEPPPGGPAPTPDQLADAQRHVDVCSFNIKALETLRLNFIKAYHGEQHQACIEAHLKRFDEATAALSSDLIEIGRLDRALKDRQADLEGLMAFAGAIDIADADAQIADLDTDCQRLQEALDDAQKSHNIRLEALPDLLSIAAMKRAVRAELATLKAGFHTALESAREPRVAADGTPFDQVKEHEAKVAALEAQYRALSRPGPRKLVFQPFDGLPHQELKRLRDVSVQGSRAGVDLGAAALNTTAAAIDLASATLGALGLGVVSGGLGMYMARLDIKDAGLELKAASGNKEAALVKIATAARLVANMDATAEPLTPAQKAMARAAARGVMRIQGRALRAQHRASNQAHLRSNKATANLGIGPVAIALATAAIVVGVTAASVVSAGVLTAPAVAAATAVGGVYIGSVATRARQRGIAKDALKQRNFAAQAFVRRHGIDGYRQLIIAMETGDRDAIQSWSEALDALVADLKQEPGARGHELDRSTWALFSPERLKDNEFLLVDLLAQGLHGQARNRVPMGQSDEAAVLKALKMPADALQYILDSHDDKPTPADHLADTKFLLCNFFGIKSYPEDRLPIQTGATLAHNAKALNRLLALTSEELHQFVLYLADHPGASPRELRRAFGIVFPMLLNELAALRHTVQHQHLIGPEQLIELQAHTHRLIPLGGAGPGATPPSSREQRAVAYLLELLTDPALLEPGAQGVPASLPAALGDAGDGPTRLKDLNSAIKARGDALRQKQTGPVQEPPEEPDVFTDALATRPKSASARARDGVQSHLRSMRSNPMGTPQKAVARLNALKERHEPPTADGKATDALVDDVSHILADLAGRAFGSEDGTTLPTDVHRTADLLLDQLEHPRSGVPAGGEQDEAFVLPLLALLESIGSTAETTADWVDRERRGLGPAGQPKASRSLDRVTERMQGLRDLARLLRGVLSDLGLRRLIVERLQQLGVRHDPLSTA